MSKQKSWNFFFQSSTLLIAIKLILSVFIIENEAGKNSAIVSALYYSIDFLILIIATIFTSNILKSREKAPAFNKIFYKVAAILILLCYFSSILNNKELFYSFSHLLKIILPIYLFSTVILYSPKDLKNRNILLLPILIISLSVFALIFLEKSKNRDEFFWPIYFSGLHTHAYVLLSTFFILFYKYSLKKSKKIKWALVFITSFSLAVGYNVRTSFTSFVVFFIVLVIDKFYKKKETKEIIIVGFFIIVYCLTIFFSSYFSVEKYDLESSGRLSVYLERINFISTRSTMENLIGSGAGSDLMVSDTWWWDEKGSHNDYLTLMIEFGVFFLFVFLYLVYKLFQFFRGNIYTQAMLFSYLTTSGLSNGLMFRPLPSYVFFLFLGYIYLLENENKIELKKSFNR